MGRPLVDLYPLAERLFALGFRLLDLDVAATGTDNLPERGPAVLASNHIGYLDFAFVALAMARPRRRVRFLVRHDMYRHAVAGPLLRALRQLEADPHGHPGRTVADAVAALRAGEVVGVHPEGTISPSFVPRPGRTGAVRMAAAADAPIVPTAVWGSHRLLTKWRPRNLQRGLPVRVAYGTPLRVDGADPQGETARLMVNIRDLLEGLWADYPDAPADDGERWWLPAHLGGTAPTPEDAERRLEEQRRQRRRRRSAELDDGADGR